MRDHQRESCLSSEVTTAADNMRIGILGGTFDPVHYGHLLLAESCREQCQLDEVRFLPAAVPPHKQHHDTASAEHRVNMLELGIGGHRPFVIDRREIERGGVSYTVDTLAELVSERPDAQWFFLMGSDSLADLPTWRDPARICQLALVATVVRAHAPPPDFDRLQGLLPRERIEQMRSHLVQMPLVDLSSRELRRRVSRGESIRYRTPRAVEEYIRAHGLYQDPPAR